MANERSDVDCGTGLLQCGNIVGKRRIAEKYCACPSRFIGSGGSPFNRTGEALMPQLPTMTVVTPCEILGNIVRSLDDAGVVVRVHVDEARRQAEPVAFDDLLRPVAFSDSPISTILPSRTATSHCCVLLPLPSSTFALRMSVSQFNILADSEYRLWSRAQARALLAHEVMNHSRKQRTNAG